MGNNEMIEVRFTDSARDKIGEELRRHKHDLKTKPGFETAGWLWASQDCAWWGGLEIVEASGPGPDAVRGYGEITLGRGYLHDLDELFRRDGLELVGNWHVHPNQNDDQPSTVDDNCIREILALRKEWDCRTQRALMIIYNPPYLRGDPWKCTPWAFHLETGLLGEPVPKPEPTILIGKGESYERIR
jgi:hypothetical protein